MSNEGEKSVGLKLLLEEAREKLQDQLEAAEAQYGFDFLAGKPAQHSNSLRYIWKKNSSVQPAEPVSRRF